MYWSMQTEVQALAGKTGQETTRPQSQVDWYHSRSLALGSICLSSGLQQGEGLGKEHWKQHGQRDDRRLNEHQLRWLPCPCPIFVWPRTPGCFSPSSPVLVGFGTSSIILSVE